MGSKQCDDQINSPLKPQGSQAATRLSLSLALSRATEWKRKMRYLQLDDWTTVQTTKKRENSYEHVSGQYLVRPHPLHRPRGRRLYRSGQQSCCFSVPVNPHSLLMSFLDFDELLLHVLLYPPALRLVRVAFAT